MITNDINLLQEGRGLIRRVLWSHLRGGLPDRPLGERTLGTWHCAETAGVEGKCGGAGGGGRMRMGVWWLQGPKNSRRKTAEPSMHLPRIWLFEETG